MASDTHSKALLLLLILALLSTAVSACSASNKTHYPMMSMDEMSAEVKAASTAVQKAYRFAAANPDVMKTIPCYCGCDSLGHTSNYDCYVASVNEYGWITFETHGLACSTCVDITEDVMNMLRDGKSPEETRSYVESTYGKLVLPSVP
jgi:hypothetical protein